MDTNDNGHRWWWTQMMMDTDDDGHRWWWTQMMMDTNDDVINRVSVAIFAKNCLRLRAVAKQKEKCNVIRVRFTNAKIENNKLTNMQHVFNKSGRNGSASN